MLISAGKASEILLAENLVAQNKGYDFTRNIEKSLNEQMIERDW
jgi:hypothetical protein